MQEMNRDLTRLADQVARSRGLSASLDALIKRLSGLEARREKLKSAAERERKDVDRLEGRSLLKLWLALTGRLDGQLDAERREAIEASVRLELVEQEIAALRTTKGEMERELGGLSGCEDAYAALLKQKAELLSATNPEGAKRVRALDEALLALDTHLREIDEASRAGAEAKEQIDVIRESLGSAEKWGTWDLWGGGMIAHMAKHSHLDDAQDGIYQLQILLDRFHVELTDVEVSRELNIEIGDFLRFADWFFDGLIADLTVLSRIEDSQSQLESVAADVHAVCRRLDAMRAEAEKNRVRLLEERSAQIISG